MIRGRLRGISESDVRLFINCNADVICHSPRKRGIQACIQIPYQVLSRTGYGSGIQLFTRSVKEEYKGEMKIEQEGLSWFH